VKLTAYAASVLVLAGIVVTSLPALSQGTMGPGGASTKSDLSGNGGTSGLLYGNGGSGGAGNTITNKGGTTTESGPTGRPLIGNGVAASPNGDPAKSKLGK
jgi:hypothetical protein